MWYVGKFDEANWHLLATVGLTPSYLREKGRGMVAAQQYITYKREVLAGDILEISSTVVEVRDKALRYIHEMHDAETGVLVASCEITAVHIDRQTRKSCPLSEEVRTAAREVLGVCPLVDGAKVSPA